MSKTIFITGTSSGLGRAAALYFAQAGWNVAATMRSPEKETELLHVNNIKIFKLDVTQPDSVTLAVRNVIAAFGTIDVVINNAGIGKYGALELASEEDMDQQWATNVRGVMNVIRAFTPHFRANGGGMFIQISSVMGLSTGMPLCALYNASKFALEGLTEALYYEMKPLKIDLRLVEPGGFDSAFSNQAVLRRESQITGYEALTDKIEYVLNHLADFPRGSVEEIVEVLDALANRRSNQFRTVVGKEAQALMEARNAVSIETFLEHAAARFE